MQSVVALQKRQLSHNPTAGLPEPQAVFGSGGEFGEVLRGLFSAWLDALKAPSTV
jgi:hypothetical protein